MRAPLNLASRPVRNDRLAAVLFAVATLLMVAVTVYHAMLVRRLMPGRSAALRHEVVGLREEMRNLQSSSEHMRPASVSAQQKTTWRVISNLVDLRTFRWSDLFASLEEALPAEASIVSVSPTAHEGHYELDVTVRLEKSDAAPQLVSALENRPEFENVYPKDCNSEQHGTTCVYQMSYLGRAGARVGGTR